MGHRKTKFRHPLLAISFFFFVLQTVAVYATAVSAAEDSALMGYSSGSIGNVMDASNESNAFILKGRIPGHVLEELYEF
jgi:hypothetical protein